VTVSCFFRIAGVGLLALLVGCGGSIVIIDPGAEGGVPEGGSDAGGGDAMLRDGGPLNCASAADCSLQAYCDRKGSCGAARGTCVLRPQGCADIYSPTCACDGKIYGNPCEANAMGQDVSAKGGCPAPPGWIPCGDKYCELHASYCELVANDAPSPGQPSVTYSCAPLPQSCTKKSDCACFPASTPCLSAGGCKAIPSGNEVGFQIICPGG
jgi:hypothetical protein